jgi:hypothetical protein
VGSQSHGLWKEADTRLASATYIVWFRHDLDQLSTTISVFRQKIIFWGYGRDRILPFFGRLHTATKIKHNFGGYHAHGHDCKSHNKAIFLKFVTS